MNKIAMAIAALALMAAALTACTGGTHGDGGSAHYQLGERAAMKGWPDVVAVEVQRDVPKRDLYDAKTLRDSIIEPAKPNEEIVVVKVRFINDAGEPFQIWSWMFTLRSQGKEIDVTDESGDRIMQDQTLPPAQELDGELAFTIVRGLRDLTLVYQPGASDAISKALDNLSKGKLDQVHVDEAVIALEP